MAHCRFNISVADIIRSQYTDQVNIACFIVSWLLLLGHTDSKSVDVRLSFSGSL